MIKNILLKINRRYPNILSILTDKLAIKLLYRLSFNSSLNLDSPKTFNEKLQWLKLYDRNPIYTEMVDKYLVKSYIANIIGKDFLIPTLGVWNHYDDIDFKTLPNQFVLKCTHDSGGLIICKNKNDLNTKDKAKIERCLRRNYYFVGREWPYKLVKPRIIAEKYMIDSKTNELRDYKFFCFNGKVKCFKIDFDRFTEHRANYYDINKNLLNFGEKNYPPDYEKNVEFPKTIDKMIQLAEMISCNIPFLRVDFYDVNGKIYFGECTFFPNSGFGEFTDKKWDYLLGSWITLPRRNEE